MTTLRRSLSLVAIAVALALGVSAVTTAAEAYPPGQHAQVGLSTTRVSRGSTLTISGSNFRPQGRVHITITCRASNPKKSYTATYRTKASDGSFSKTITIGPDFPSGRCIVTASTGTQALNSDRATFFVNNANQSAQSASDTGLAGFDSTATAKSGTTAAKHLVATADVGSGSNTGMFVIAGLAIVFLLGGGVILLASRRRYAAVKN